ncbi:MAG: C40 family peptidase [Desulfobacter sp.]|nr:MAG: C40 family peptidase [Desulfobacter sp.]
MKRISVHIIIILLWMVPAWPSYTAKSFKEEASASSDAGPESLFLSQIPTVAEQFIGMPFKMGGRPSSTGTTDNSSLFYAIYTTAAQNAGLTYTRAYLPMKYLVKNMVPVNPEAVRNGDLIVLNNNLAAMVYRVGMSGRMHFIYASQKRQQVISFHSGNLVYQAYWLEHLKGFFRLKKDMLQP